MGKIVILARYKFHFIRVQIIPPQIKTSYDRIAKERPVYTVIDHGKIYAGLSLVILSYDVIIKKGYYV